MHLGFEMNPQGLGVPVLEYVPAGMQAQIGGQWLNTGSAEPEWLNLNHGSASVDTGWWVHYWQREVYSSLPYILVEPGEEEVALGTWDDWRSSVIRGDAFLPITIAFRFGDTPTTTGGGSYNLFGQFLWQLANAEYVYAGCNGVTNVDSTIPGSIDYSEPIRMVYDTDLANQNTWVDSNFKPSSTFHALLGLNYTEDQDWDWDNTVIVFSYELGRANSAKLWKNGVEKPVNNGQGTPPYLFFDYTDKANDTPNPGLGAPADLQARSNVEQINREWFGGVDGPDDYPYQWWGSELGVSYDATYGWTCSPKNIDIDAHYVLLEGQISESATPQPGLNQGLTHFAAWRGIPTQEDITTLQQQWQL